MESISGLPLNMLEAHVDVDSNVTLHQSPLPTLTSPHHMLVRVRAAGTNPKDWKMPAGILKTIGNCPNSGDDIAGVVVALGSSAATSFRLGDRIAGLHELGAPGGAFAEYALVYDYSSFRIPADWPFERAAGLPMISLMASIGVFAMLRLFYGSFETLPQPSDRPFLVYGAASGVGSMAVKMARIMGCHPIICVAGRGADFVEGLIDRSADDTIVDYRNGSEATIRGIQDALRGRRLNFAFDAVSSGDTFANVAAVLDKDEGRVSLVLPQLRPEFARERQSTTMAGMLFKQLKPMDASSDVGHMGADINGPEFGYVATGMISRWIAAGKLEAHPFEVLEGGLGALEGALKKLRAGEVSAQKLIVKLD